MIYLQIFLIFILVSCSTVKNQNTTLSRAPSSSVDNSSCIKSITTFFNSKITEQNIIDKEVLRSLKTGIEVEGVISELITYDDIAEKMKKIIQSVVGAQVSDFTISKNYKGVELSYKIGNQEKTWEVKNEYFRNIPKGHHAIEITSPIMSKEADYLIYENIFNELKNFGLKEFSEGSGIHIHLSSHSMSKKKRETVINLFEALNDQLRNAFGAIPTRGEDYGAVVYKEGHGTLEFRLFNGVIEKDYLEVAMDLVTKIHTELDNENVKLLNYIKNSNLNLNEISKIVKSNFHLSRAKLDKINESKYQEIAKTIFLKEYDYQWTNFKDIKNSLSLFKKLWKLKGDLQFPHRLMAMTYIQHLLKELGTSYKKDISDILKYIYKDFNIKKFLQSTSKEKYVHGEILSLYPNLDFYQELLENVENAWSGDIAMDLDVISFLSDLLAPSFLKFYNISNIESLEVHKLSHYIDILHKSDMEFKNQFDEILRICVKTISPEDNPYNNYKVLNDLIRVDGDTKSEELKTFVTKKLEILSIENKVFYDEISDRMNKFQAILNE